MNNYKMQLYHLGVTDEFVIAIDRKRKKQKMKLLRILFKKKPAVASEAAADPTNAPGMTERASVRAAREEAARAETQRVVPGALGERKIYRSKPKRKIMLKRSVPDPSSALWPSEPRETSHLDRRTK